MPLICLKRDYDSAFGHKRLRCRRATDWTFVLTYYAYETPSYCRMKNIILYFVEDIDLENKRKSWSIFVQWTSQRERTFVDIKGTRIIIWKKSENLLRTDVKLINLISTISGTKKLGLQVPVSKNNLALITIYCSVTRFFENTVP